MILTPIGPPPAAGPPAAPLSGWAGWRALKRSAGGGGPLQVGRAHFTGPPRNGVVEIGYAIESPFRGQGYGPEMVATLVHWALHQPGVKKIIADTAADNGPSIRMLERLGFNAAGPGRGHGEVRFEIVRKESAAESEGV
jgi:[ribosomal protein S5]-alanine N-acetyltransferase